MRIFGITVGKNEADRYLAPMLQHHLHFLDQILFFDDRSDDNTVPLAKDAGCIVELRDVSTPSFVENEGAFRDASWRAFEEKCRPREGDWVLSIDCDETLIAVQGVDPVSIRAALDEEIGLAGDQTGIDLYITEIWGFDDFGNPLLRCDGQWDNIHGPRLFAYRPFGQIEHNEMGAPAHPTYVRPPYRLASQLVILHYGYADRRDHVAKYLRYSGRVGHSSAHVESILTEPELAKWDGPYVKEMRRRR